MKLFEKGVADLKEAKCPVRMRDWAPRHAYRSSKARSSRILASKAASAWPSTTAARASSLSKVVALEGAPRSVSYTHLTLPTILLV